MLRPAVRLGVLIGERPSPFLFHRDFTAPIPSGPTLGRVGRAGLLAYGLSDPWSLELPSQAGEAHLFGLDSPFVASATGVVALFDGRVIEDTLDHLSTEDGIGRPAPSRVELPGNARPLPGTWFSLLLGSSGNWFHFMLMNLSRLALLDEEQARSLDGLLVPPDLPPNSRRLLERAVGAFCARFGRSWPALFEVGSGQTVRPQRLLLGWNVASERRYQPSCLAFLSGLVASSPMPNRRLYVDRRAAGLRPLRNEDAVVELLAAHGFVAVRLEGLNFDAQAQLFAEAAFIVAPHGAGLSNLAFVPPGTSVIELMPHRLGQWCYRRLCAVRGLSYEAVIGEQEEAPPSYAGFRVDLNWLRSAVGLMA
jgi:hypothetical protein